MKNLRKIVGLLSILLFCSFKINASISNTEATNRDQSKVVTVVRKVENYIKENGIKKAMIKFKNAKDIFMGNYDGLFFISPLHPDLIGKSQFNYKDPSGVMVVQEEINKAKAGGGWLKGRWRYNSLIGIYQCRKIYILPITGNYFIGSWYHYSSDKQGICVL